MAKTPSSQYRKPRSESWSGNWIPHTTTKDPTCSNERSHVSQQRSKILHATTKTQQSQIKWKREEERQRVRKMLCCSGVEAILSVKGEEGAMSQGL